MIADKLAAFELFYKETLGWGWDAEAMVPRPPRLNQTPWLPDNPLRQRMLQDTGLRNLTARTQKEHLRWIGKVTSFHKESPSALGLEEMVEKKMPSTFAVARASLKFLYTITLRRPYENFRTAS